MEYEQRWVKGNYSLSPEYNKYLEEYASFKLYNEKERLHVKVVKSSFSSRFKVEPEGKIIAFGIFIPNQIK